MSTQEQHAARWARSSPAAAARYMAARGDITIASLRLLTAQERPALMRRWGRHPRVTGCLSWFLTRPDPTIVTRGRLEQLYRSGGMSFNVCYSVLRWLDWLDGGQPPLVWFPWTCAGPHIDDLRAVLLAPAEEWRDDRL